MKLAHMHYFICNLLEDYTGAQIIHYTISQYFDELKLCKIMRYAAFNYYCSPFSTNVYSLFLILKSCNSNEYSLARRISSEGVTD